MFIDNVEETSLSWNMFVSLPLYYCDLSFLDITCLRFQQNITRIFFLNNVNATKIDLINSSLLYIK